MKGACIARCSSAATSSVICLLLQACIILCCISQGRSGERGMVPSSSLRQRCGSTSREWATRCNEAGTPMQSFIVVAAALSILVSEGKGVQLLPRSMLKFSGSLFFRRRERIIRPNFLEASWVSRSLSHPVRHCSAEPLSLSTMHVRSQIFDFLVNVLVQEILKCLNRI